MNIAPKDADESVPRARADQSSDKGAFTVIVITVYLIIGVIAFWPVIPGSGNRLFGSTTPDAGLMVWFIGWVAHRSLMVRTRCLVMPCWYRVALTSPRTPRYRFSQHWLLRSLSRSDL